MALSDLLGSIYQGTKNEGKGSSTFGIDSPFGTVAAGKYGSVLQATPGQERYASIFDALGPQFLQQAQGQSARGLDALPFDLSSVIAGLGQDANTAALSKSGTDFLGLSDSLASAFQNFDRDAFATEQKARLDRIAGPAEANAANSLANKLFARGRLGGSDTFSGRAFGELSTALAGANDQRAMTALGLADQERNSLGNLSSLFANLGSGLSLGGANLAGLNLGNVASAASAYRGDQGFQNDVLSTILGLGTGSLTGGQQAYAPLQQALQNLYTQRDQAQNSYQLRQGAKAARGSDNTLGTALGGIAGGAIGTYLLPDIGGKLGATLGGQLGGAF